MESQNRETYREKMDPGLKKMKIAIDRLEAALREKDAGVQTDAQDRLDELRRKADMVHARLEVLEASSGDAWNVAKEDVANAWHDLESSCRKAREEFEDR